MVKRFVPSAGDVVWLDFDPQAGHEQAGHRPAVVISDFLYNRNGLMLCVPVTTKIKSGPWEVDILSDVPSVALSDQINSMDWKARNAQLKDKVSPEILEEIRYNASLLLGSE